MFSTAKGFTAVAIILGVANTLMSAVLALMFVPEFRMGWTFEFASIGFFFANALGWLLLGFGMLSMNSDLKVSEEANASAIRALKKRIDELENRIKNS